MTLLKEESTTDTSKLLILGSGSTYEKLLSSVGLIPDIVKIPNVDESLKLKESLGNMSRE